MNSRFTTIFFSFMVMSAMVFAYAPSAASADTTASQDILDETRSGWEEMKAKVEVGIDTISNELQKSLLESGRAFLVAIQDTATEFMSELQSRISGSGKASQAEQDRVTQTLANITENIENKQAEIASSQSISDLENIAKSIQTEVNASKEQLEPYKIAAVYETLTRSRNRAAELQVQLNEDIKKLNQSGKNTVQLQSLAGQYQSSLDSLDTVVTGLQTMLAGATTEANVAEGLEFIQSGKQQLTNLQRISQDIVGELRKLAGTN